MSESSSPPSQTSGSRLNDKGDDHHLTDSDLTADLDLGFDGADDILRAWRRGVRPDPDLTVSGWADAHRWLSSRASAEPGRYRTALTVYQAQERQLSIQRKKGVLVDRARAETLVFRLARQERDVWVTWPTRVAALMAAQLAAEMEAASGEAVTIETAILQRVLEAHVREQLTALADLRVSLE